MAKKIVAIVSLAIIGVLIIATIVMANIDVNHGIECSKPSEIKIQYSSLSAVVTANEEEKSKIEKYINSENEESVLRALFHGTLSSGTKVKTIEEKSKSIPSTSDFYVRYVYNTRQTLKEGKKDYKDAGSNKYYYKELWFTVSSSENATSKVAVYILPWSDEGTTSKQYSKYYELKVDLSDLYDYLSSLSYFAN